ncbi:MAG: cell division protein FtsQ/DivIB [Armatimonadota bacterium]
MRGRPSRRGRGGSERRSNAGSAADRAESARLRRKAALTGISLVLASAVVGGLLGILASDLFAVRSVEIDSEDESLAAEAAESAEKMAFGTIWLPPMREIEGRIGGLPRAKSVRVGRELPSTLTIEVEPRTPVAVVQQGDRFMVVDPDGVCMHWTGGVPDGLPRIRIETPSSLRVGGRLSRRDVEMMNAVRRGLGETGLLEDARIDLSRPVRVEVWTAGGVLGKLGNQEMLEEKALLFARLLDGLSEQGEAPLYIDLRVPSRPTFKRVD